MKVPSRANTRKYGAVRTSTTTLPFPSTVIQVVFPFQLVPCGSRAQAGSTVNAPDDCAETTAAPVRARAIRTADDTRAHGRIFTETPSERRRVWSGWRGILHCVGRIRRVRVGQDTVGSG